MKSLIIFSLIAFTMLSCSNNNENNPGPINLDKNHVKVAWPTYQDTVKILSSERELFIRSDNAAIADATIKDDSIFVSTHDFGSTTIDVYDLHNNSFSIEIDITGFNTDEVWIVLMSEPSINEEVDDNIKEAIKTEVNQDFNWLYGFNYKFNADNSVIVYNGYAFYREGSYSIENKILSIDLIARTPLPAVSCEGLQIVFPISIRDFVSANVDLTDKYKQTYPDNGITTVTSTVMFMKKTWF